MQIVPRNMYQESAAGLGRLCYGIYERQNLLYIIRCLIKKLEAAGYRVPQDISVTERINLLPATLETKKVN